jgi:hypothetical protein
MTASRRIRVSGQALSCEQPVEVFERWLDCNLSVMSDVAATVVFIEVVRLEKLRDDAQQIIRWKVVRMRGPKIGLREPFLHPKSTSRAVRNKFASRRHYNVVGVALANKLARYGQSAGALQTRTRKQSLKTELLMGKTAQRSILPEVINFNKGRIHLRRPTCHARFLLATARRTVHSRVPDSALVG